jgi:MraZ protein
VFLGTHSPRLDDKGRLFLPAKFRDELAEGVVITKGQDNCLYVYRRADFARMADQLHSTPATDRNVRSFSRMLFASASDEVPDRQGRITVPASLREYARLSRDCKVVGANNRLEIWDAAAWDRYEADHEQAYADQAEEVLPGVL